MNENEKKILEGRERIGGKGDRRDCTNYRGISILSIPEKIYGKLLVE